MNDTVSVGKASLDALTESMRAMSARLAKVEAENAELRALLARFKTSLSERFNDPAQGDPVEASQ